MRRSVQFFSTRRWLSSSCSVEYRTEISSYKTADISSTKILYAVGGLYGNVLALEKLNSLVRRDVDKYHDVTVVFNGDFNFFNIDKASWIKINSEIQQKFGLRTGAKVIATKGNIEHEVASREFSGCGCAYPDDVDPKVSLRAGAIVDQLREIAHSKDMPHWILPWLRNLNWHTTFRIGSMQITLVHGDPDCVNGWSLAANAKTSQHIVERFFDNTNSSILACTHTCLAHLTQIPDGRIIINNGSAGISNFQNSTSGLVSRIAPTNAPPLDPNLCAFGSSLADIRVDALHLHFDSTSWLQHFFLPNWPPESPAHSSYYDRISFGVPHWTPQHAERGFLSASPGNNIPRRDLDDS
mmetsp:Transcript_9836/g.12329  ORF Transcript_9836/g.12329 Transcript_9836/m.12329 type:complete len:354 (+) Transcript_9836:3-1064(+)